MNYRIVLLLTLLLFVITKHNSYSKVFKHYNSNGGLIHNSVLGITQDSKGFMWFSTPVGISRFNGKNFHSIYFKDQQNIQGRWLGSQILTDRHDNIWVRNDSQVGLYNRQNDQIDFFDYKRPGHFHIEGYPQYIVKDKNHNLILRSNKKTYRFDNKQQKFISIKIPIAEGKSILKLFQDNSKNWWIITYSEILVIESLNSTSALRTIKGLPRSNNITSTGYHLMEGHYGKIYLTIPQHGLYIIDKLTYEIKSIKASQLLDHKTLSSNIIRCMNIDPQGNIYLGTSKGINCLNPFTGYIDYFIQDFNNNRSLSDNSVYNIFFDRHGNMWASTYFGGVNLWAKNSNVFQYYKAGNAPKNLSGKAVSQMQEDKYHNIWIATEDGGLSYFNPINNTFKHILVSNNITPRNIHSFYVKDNSVLLGSWYNGLQEYQYQPYNINHLQLKKQVLPNSISTIFPINSSEFLVGSQYGLILYNRKKNTTLSVTGIQQWLHIRNIIRTHDNRILVSTDSQGVYLYDVISQKCFPFLTQFESIPQNITFMFESSDCSLWIGTFENGLYHFDLEKNTVKHFTKADGLPDETIYSIVEDQNARLWLTSNKGLICFNTNTNTFLHFTNNDGLPINQFNYQSNLLHSNGKIYLGTVNGLIAFNPLEVGHNIIFPEIQITDFFLDNKRVTPKHENEILKQPIYSTNELTLEHNQNNIAFEFAAIDYTSPENIEYSCKMENFDKQWLELGRHNKVTYSRLPAGEYTFKIRAKTNPDLWNSKPKSIKVTVLPSFWQSKWGYMLYTLIVILIISIYIYYLKERHKAKALLELERIEKNKIKELNQLKTEFYTNVSHEFKTPLSLIIDPIKRISSNEVTPTEIHQVSSIALRNIERLNTLINHLLDFNKSEANAFELAVQPMKISKWIDTISLRFLSLAQKREIDFHIQIDPVSSKCWFDPEIMDTVLTNLLSNAFKFTPPKGKISLSVKKLENTKPMMLFEIKDSGIGIDKTEQNKIFDRFYKSKSEENDLIGTGIGLPLSKHLIELHHGSIDVESKKGEGSTFIVKIPCSKLAYQANEWSKNSYLFTSEDTILNETPLKTLPSKSKSNSKILIVEDNLDLQQYLTQLLQKTYNVKTASNGVEAWEYLQNHKPDIIISDVMMPQMDGFELCDKIKSDLSTSHIPVILLTAKTEEQDKTLGLRKGADLYLEKPFNSEILLSYLRNLEVAKQNIKTRFEKDLGINLTEVTYSDKDEEFIQKAIKIVFDNMQNDTFDVKQFIAEMAISKSLLYTKLKEISGMTATQFIQSIRMKEAARLLQTNQFNINETATKVGFADPAYFSRCFKKQFQCSPSEFVKQEGTTMN
ncbi:response regulator [Prolixibacteraceae bacterium JC049]|nr:response regulator [Prolixibacteraceae bacterium JC049]